MAKAKKKNAVVPRAHREEVVQVMVTAEQKEKFVAAASKKGLSTSAYVLMHMLPIVEEQLKP